MTIQNDTKIRIDYDRGVIFMTHQPTGANVYMYTDTPGVYLNAFAKPVGDDMAREAGFPVEKYAKEKVRRERMAQAMEAIDSELSKVAEDEHQVLSDVKGFKVIDIGLGRHNVQDPDGNVLNSVPLSIEVANKLVERLVPKD